MPRVYVLVNDTDRQPGGEVAAIRAARHHESRRGLGDPDVERPDGTGTPGTAMQLERILLLEPHALAKLVDRNLRLGQRVRRRALTDPENNLYRLPPPPPPPRFDVGPLKPR